MPICADQDWHIAGRFGGGRVKWGVVQPAADDGREAVGFVERDAWLELRSDALPRPYSCFHEQLVRHLSQTRDIADLQSELLEQVTRPFGLVIVRRETDAWATLDGRARKQAFRLFHRQQSGDLARAPRFTKNQYALRIASEASDIVANPPQTKDYVVQPKIAAVCKVFARKIIQMKEAKRSEAVINPHDNGITTPRDGRAVAEC